MTETSDDPFRIEVVGVAATAAECADIELRKTDSVRLVFRPKIVNNPNDERAGVRGKLLYQRKKKSSDWQDVDAIPLTRVKKDEAVAIELSSEECLKLRESLSSLQDIKNQHGVPQSNNYFICVQRAHPLEVAFGGPKSRVILPSSSSPDDLRDVLAAIIETNSVEVLAQTLQKISPSELAQLQVQTGLSLLDELLDEWGKNENNSDESFWQGLFERYPFALEQIFHTPFIVLGGRAYVGGKLVSDQGGKYPDFLFEAALGHRACLVEIKTPQTQLFTNKPYRGNVWAPSEDLTGGLVQTITYRDTLMESLPTVGEETKLLRRVIPQTALVIGTLGEVEKDKARCFNRFRDRSDCIVMTFDEVLLRLRRTREVMRLAARSEARDEH
jgi:hypothetical protein